MIQDRGPGPAALGEAVGATGSMHRLDRSPARIDLRAHRSDRVRGRQRRLEDAASRFVEAEIAFIHSRSAAEGHALRARGGGRGDGGDAGDRGRIGPFPRSARAAAAGTTRRQSDQRCVRVRGGDARMVAPRFGNRARRPACSKSTEKRSSAGRRPYRSDPHGFAVDDVNAMAWRRRQTGQIADNGKMDRAPFRSSPASAVRSFRTLGGAQVHSRNGRPARLALSGAAFWR